MSRPATPPVAARPLTLDDLDYDLPEGLVAQRPAEPRDASRLLVWRGAAQTLEDHRFAELPGLLRPGDVLVRNDTRVFPARTFFRRASGGRIEVLFLRPAAQDAARGGGAGTEPLEGPSGVWEALLRGRPRPREVLRHEVIGDDWPLTCERPLGDGRWVVRSEAGPPVDAMLDRVGVTPLPPYIHERLDDPGRYQTTYARVRGSAAAPTAGLHFTPQLDRRLAARGVSVATVTLHVGLGTFKPLQEPALRENRLHAETYSVDASVWSGLLAAHAEGRRIVAVGTTSMRTLEHLARADHEPDATGLLRGETDLFIAPGFSFRLVGGLITNFHLPRTSLLALVMAFCGVDETRRIYGHAVAARYRFYSFGDAMLALPGPGGGEAVRRGEVP